MEISEEKIFNPNKLEKLLIKHWTDFIDARKLLELLRNIHNNPSTQITNLTVSYCELSQQGIMLWISYNIVNSNESVNMTNEILLTSVGDFKILSLNNI